MDTITEQMLKKNYGKHATMVLDRFLELIPKAKKGERKRYKIKESLPNTEDYTKLMEKRFTTSIDDLVNSSFDTLDELKGELEEWFENLPDQLQSSNKGDELQEAIDGLDSISRIELPESLTGDILFIPWLEDSKESRRDEAVAKLQAVVECIREDFQDLADEIENSISDIEMIEFPRIGN